MSRVIPFTAGLVAVWIVGYLLVIGSSLLIPIIVALFIWNIVNIFVKLIQDTPVIGRFLPYWLSLIVSLLILSMGIAALVHVVSDNIKELIRLAPTYQRNLLEIADNFQTHSPLKFNPETMLQGINVQRILVNFYNAFASITGSAILIFLYVVFLFVEQHFFEKKIAALFPQTSHWKLANSILMRVTKDVQSYLGLKTLMGFITAFFSWIIMVWLGLDFADFWALLIFFLNYIPNIGAFIATAFPVLLSLIQFQSWLVCLSLLSGLVAVQFVVGSLLEPRFIGKSLNLSPLVILITLALWGTVWGVTGMFLSVPITVIMLIMFSHFEATRPFAILLSRDGQVNTDSES